MSTEPCWNRRQWLRHASVAVAAPFAAHLLPGEALLWGRELHATLDAQGGAPGLDDDTMRLLSSVCDRIIPADDTPGAIGAGVPRFVDHMLAHWYDPPERARVVSGLQELGRQAFADAPGAQQDAWLLDLDAQGGKSWFGTVKYLTIWGYYTSEVGVKQELGQWPSPTRYDGCAPYEPRIRSTAQPQIAVEPRRPHVAG